MPMLTYRLRLQEALCRRSCLLLVISCCGKNIFPSEIGEALAKSI
jgi:hypothetical protein